MNIGKKYGIMGLTLALTWFLGACGTESPSVGTGGAPAFIGAGAGKGGAVVTNIGQGGSVVVSQGGKIVKGTGGSVVPKGKGGAGGTVGKGGAEGSAGKAGGDAGKSGGNSTTLPDGHCLATPPADYFANSTFEFERASSGAVNMRIPKVPAGCKVPVIHLANGTGGTCSFYTTVLDRLASHGFVAVCYENGNTGAGKFGLEALKTALAEYPDLVDMRFGSTGHSQGGMASFNTLAYAEKEWGDQAIYAGFALEPASGFGANPTEGWQTLYGGIKSPMLMFSGLGTDTLVAQTWVQQAYDAMSDTVEKYFWTKAGANHIGTISVDTNEVIVPWFRWKLLGDQKACEAWRAIPTNDTSWAQVASNNEQPCK